MKKFLFVLLATIGFLFAGTNSLNAQNKVKVGDGVYLVTYGNVTVIEDDNKGMTYQLKVESAGTNKAGEKVYNVLCKNKLIKGVAKAGLAAAMKSALAGIAPSWLVGTIVNYAYDAACDYFQI